MDHLNNKNSQNEFNSISKPNKSQLSKLKKINAIEKSAANLNDYSIKLIIGMKVNHGRFGKGKVLSLEGVGSDKKAVIEFEGFGIKNLLVRFAKLTSINDL